MMEHSVSHSGQDHVISISRGDVASTSTYHEDDESDSDGMQHKSRPSTSTQPPFAQSPQVAPITSNSRNASTRGRGDNNGQRRRSPLNSGLWISVEFFVNLTQIVAAVTVLALSRHENRHSPLFAWIVGYTVGCVATLPHLLWRYMHRNGQETEQEPTHSYQSSSQDNPPGSTPYSTVSFSQVLEGENRLQSNIFSRFGQNFVITGSRLNALVDHFKMALDCFFAVWFVVGNVWLFGGHTSAADSPNLYRLCIAFLTFSCVGYAMPFILCAIVCCCLPCIISVAGFREDLGHTRGATAESINALPTYKFKSKRNISREDCEIGSEEPSEGGILAVGTNKERIISAEDAVCCVCLGRYLDNDELRELPCTHFFHIECVDKWLKINALCPLCKSEVVDEATGFSAFFSSYSHRGRTHDRRAGSGDGADSRV
ncbi:putative E3 ubiquitin-protein ligase [Iris pallida]|uniref:E3 ubiquitin-protein ligase n=1 Tax=Iris pallida TaxID=29817 RepID=A0AAX6I0R6_IRIPA|nr:putative E3 ubiquitin-protein ligase [Iris pallida]